MGGTEASLRDGVYSDINGSGDCNAALFVRVASQVQLLMASSKSTSSTSVVIPRPPEPRLPTMFESALSIGALLSPTTPSMHDLNVSQAYIVPLDQFWVSFLAATMPLNASLTECDNVRLCALNRTHGLRHVRQGMTNWLAPLLGEVRSLYNWIAEGIQSVIQSLDSAGADKSLEHVDDVS